MIIKAKVVAHQRVSNVIKRNNLYYLWLYNTLCKIAIYSICLVICAGGFVRMTGSGMGCPDWPKCFGEWIPPTHISDLPQNYKDIYAERGYDKLDFNAFNTWTEYINRLLGFIAGLVCVAILFVSFFTRKKLLIVLSFFLVFLMGFQAWMGALVVYSLLAPFKISIHMLIALLILSMVFFLYRVTRKNNTKHQSFYSKWIWFALTISLVQIILGTQVREEVDALLSYVDRSNIIAQIPFVFEFHRTIAWLVFISNAWLIYYYRHLFNVDVEFKLIVVTILALFSTGVLMTYHNLIGIYQLLHLILAVSLFICQISILMKHSTRPIVDFP